jgi:hemin uptake protein HemP
MGSIVQSLVEAPNAFSEIGGDKHQFSTPGPRSIRSESLFSEGDEVYIQHRGEQYLLRRTRNGKLILTK